MDEERLLQMLKDSAEQIRIPVSLQPEQAAERLLEAKRKRQREWLKKIRTYAAMAAGVVVLIGAVAAAGRYGLFSGSMSGAQKESTAAACGGDDAGQDGGSMVSETAEDAKNEEREAGTPTSADSLYRPAEDYGDVYDNVDRAWKNQEICLEGGQKSVDKSESTDTATIASTSSEGAVGYSATNTQNENVDEGDFVKTDGDFLYVASGSDIYIVDIRDGVMQKPARLSLESLAGETKNGNSIHEIYVEGGLLQVVCGNREEVVYIYEPDEKVYRMKEKSQVKVFTFDLSDKIHPRLVGKFVQDGVYQSSRRNDGYLYLFTKSLIAVPEGRHANIQEDSVDGWLPCVNGKVPDFADIYLPEDGGNQAVTISSIADDAPSGVEDSKTVILGGASEYVSETGIYLYREENNGQASTSVVKFRYKAGEITMAGGVYVDGSVRDSFAVNEKEGYLRVLTTTYDPEWENHVYILDDSMQLCGKLEGLAPGEEIYSARFLGDYGFFVTYRNTDPLFSVDLSDPRDPRIVGELKVTGFSDYLHFWKEDRLLGIGLETDPETGQQMGVKLSMFDVSDPNNVTEENRAVLSKISDTAACGDYKVVLVDEGRNLIGFPARDYTGVQRYLIYGYSAENGFEKVFSSEVAGVTRGSEVRGLYAGRFFYLVTGDRAEAYDMEQGFKEAGTVIF